MIPFSPPYIDQDVIDEVVDALRSGWITTGPKTKQLEKELAAYCQAQRVLCLNSATAGLELILRWFGVGEGDEVIVPAYTYTATANVVLHCGATPVMVDTDENFLIDLDQAKAAITEKTKAIMPVDLFGFPCDYDGLKNLVESPEIKLLFKPSNNAQKSVGRILLLVDAAHSVGGLYKGKKIGSQLDAMVFSFHAVKNLTTAEGGAVCLNFPGVDHDQLYRELGIKSLHGQTKDALSKTQSGGWKYDIVEAGYKYNMPDVLAAIGLASLKKYDSYILPRRREIFDLYSKYLKDYSWAQIPVYETADRVSCCHVYPLRIRNITEMERDQIIELLAGRGISTNVHFQPLPMLSLFKALGYSINNYPVSYDNYSREISLPVYPQLTDEQVRQITSSIAEIVEKNYVKEAV